MLTYHHSSFQHMIQLVTALTGKPRLSASPSSAQN